MSVVACKILENGYEMASDSICVCGWTQSRGENQNFSKLFEVNNIVIGGVGKAQDNSLMQLFLQTHGISNPDEKSILEFIAEFSLWKKEKTDDAFIENEYLIGYQGKVFQIHKWMISEVKTYTAIGAGMDFALASLYLGHSTKKAVETAIELSIYCENPIITIKKLIETT
jgi:hypothetical protein